MKKFMLGMIFLSVMVFGVDLQEVNPASMASEDIEIGFQNNEKMNYVKTEPAQFTLKVPVNLEKVPIGIAVNDGSSRVTVGGQQLGCNVTGGGKQFYSYVSVHPGSYVAIVKFNGIPYDMLQTIDSYHCQIGLKISNDRYLSIKFFPENIFEIKNNRISGSL